jgi:cytochrome c-type biogenesis protein CcmH/NrfG
MASPLFVQKQLNFYLYRRNQSMKKIRNFLRQKSIAFAVSAKQVLTDRRGQATLDTAITILISVVLGALLLTGLYALFGNTIMPTVTQKIKDMFNYQG